VLGSVALGSVAKLIAGPGGVAKAMSAAADNRISTALVATATVAFAEAAILALAARRVARWRG
jgi:small neutral amino acid transporter SnatA (MarC family)